uniref:Reverse transcriptase zinc-binding domain-containing protein n=1 Tax=Tanacetum cinerariifolium TaxID=118510 RepID=A0A699JJL1_TANCI|nr:hypothetical protein [Tanacetum cinerariifolium]
MTRGWRKILQLCPLIREFCCFKIEDGSCTSIWFDNRCSLSPLASIISSRDIYRAGLTSNSKVSDLLLEGTLVWPPDLIARYPTLLSVTSPSMVGPCDQQEWRNRSGNIVPFLVNEFRNSIRPMAAKVNWFRVICFTNCIPRHTINFWLIIKKRLRTQDMLCSWDISGCLATNCPLCDMQPDSHEHLFFDCTLSKSIWDRVKIMAGLSNLIPSINFIVSDILPFANRHTTRSVIVKLVVAATAFKLTTCRFKKLRDGLAILRAENLAADHLSRLENPHQDDLENKEINKTFPLETLGMISSRSDSSTSWFADIANYHARNFSKWVEAKVIPTNNARVVVKFLKSLFSRFGTPHAIISDCGENRASWSDKLDDALWAFRTAFKTPIRFTPYKLVYEKACHLPIELEHEAYWALTHYNFDLKSAGDHQKV